MADQIIVDPLGRKITLYEHTWYGHIVPGHPEMRRLRAQTITAIESPEVILVSLSDAHCRLYYSRPLENSSIRIRVVADVVRGIVKSAYKVKQMKGGTSEWPLPMP